VSEKRDELRRQLNTVWRSAVDGFDTLREVVVRSSQSGRLRVDLALLAREKQQLLVRLGEQVAALVSEGALELPEEVNSTYERLREIERRIDTDSVKTHDNAFGAPRGYEPEAGNYVDDTDELEPDEHAEVATPHRRPKGETR